MITCPCNEHPLPPHFYIVKLGFRGVFIFLIFALKHRLWVLVRTASPRRFRRVATIYVLSKNKKKYFNISSENKHFYSREILLYIAWACLRTKCTIQIVHQLCVWIPRNGHLVSELSYTKFCFTHDCRHFQKCLFLV